MLDGAAIIQNDGTALGRSHGIRLFLNKLSNKQTQRPRINVLELSNGSVIHLLLLKVLICFWLHNRGREFSGGDAALKQDIELVVRPVLKFW